MAEIRKSTPHDLSLQERFRTRSQEYYSRSTTFIKRRPFASFFLVLGLLLLLLIIGSLTQPKPSETEERKITKNVKVFSIGEGPQATLQAKVQKSGVIQIVAQAPGIVHRINIKEGEKVMEGQQIISLASNYQGGNVASVQTQIAQTQYQNVLDTFGTQNDLIQQQRNVATASAELSQQTRDATRDAFNDTKDQLNASQAQLEQVNTALQGLQQNNIGDTNSEQIAELQGTALQLQGGINQLRAAQRTSELQSANDRPPAQIAGFQKEIALKQLDIQQKALELNKEVSRLQVQLAYVNEAIMYPASPFTGTVEKINVEEGQAVQAGAVLATVAASEIETTAVLLVPQNIVNVLKTGEPSQIVIRNKNIAVTPYHVSTQATDGQLYSVFYKIPEASQKYITDGEYIPVKVPLGKANTSAADPLIPIDAVYQTTDKAYVLIAKDKKAVSREIKPGNVFGNYVAIEQGLKSGDQIILNRNVIADDSVKIN